MKQQDIIERKRTRSSQRNPHFFWHVTFREQSQQIIELWHMCFVSIIHMTRFYLLFINGDPADQIYMEVELRRLTWLQ